MNEKKHHPSEEKKTIQFHGVYYTSLSILYAFLSFLLLVFTITYPPCLIGTAVALYVSIKYFKIAKQHLQNESGSNSDVNDFYNNFLPFNQKSTLIENGNNLEYNSLLVERLKEKAAKQALRRKEFLSTQKEKNKEALLYGAMCEKHLRDQDYLEKIEDTP